MYKRKETISVVITCVFLIISFGSCADQSFNIERLEKEVTIENKVYPLETSERTVFADYRIGNCRNLMLSVKTLREGNATPAGSVLNIRILNDGRVEYDVHNSGTRAMGVRREQTMLSAETLGKINGVLNSETVKNLKPSYDGDHYCCDVYMKTSVDFCQEQKLHSISIVESDTVIHLKRKNKIPKDIIELFRMVNQITETESIEMVE